MNKSVFLLLGLSLLVVLFASTLHGGADASYPLPPTEIGDYLKPPQVGLSPDGATCQLQNPAVLWLTISKPTWDSFGYGFPTGTIAHSLICANYLSNCVAPNLEWYGSTYYGNMIYYNWFVALNPFYPGGGSYPGHVGETRVVDVYYNQIHCESAPFWFTLKGITLPMILQWALW